MIEISKDPKYRHPFEHGWTSHTTEDCPYFCGHDSIQPGMMQGSLQSCLHTQVRSAAPMLAVGLTCTTAYARHVSTRLTPSPMKTTLCNGDTAREIALLLSVTRAKDLFICPSLLAFFSVGSDASNPARDKSRLR